MHISNIKCPQTTRHLLIVLCVQQRWPGHLLCPGEGWLLRGEKRGLFVCMCCFFSLQHPSYQKITQTEFALQKPLPRQLESEQL